MKRLVFCFDGTWDRLDAPSPTNVVLTAQSVSPRAPDGTVQIIHYDQGVGTARYQRWTGGLFGAGLLDNIVDAYTFLVFNYEVGDEIHVFGFSRGAFTARSFAGLLRNIGILRRRDAGRIGEAVLHYEHRGPREDHDSPPLLKYRLDVSPEVCVDAKEDAWRCVNKAGYRSGDSPVFRIRYMGIWDTVGSLGVPDGLAIAAWINRQYQFHDLKLSPMAVSARHAVAIDESRRSFAPTLWNNFEALNASLGFAADDPAAPYQQKWFPGVHGSVGGGGDVRGLSDIALDWVISGARAAGLCLDTGADSRIFGLAPNPLAPLVNASKPAKGLWPSLMGLLPKRPRSPGPAQLCDLAPDVLERWRQPAAALPETALYRPRTLHRVAHQLDEAVSAAAPETPAPTAAAPTTASPRPGAHYQVVRGDTLSAIALKAYGAAWKGGAILAANSRLLSNPDRIYVGQVLYLPPDNPAQGT
jgi:uncharacterized protein (DUF2235 family)